MVKASNEIMVRKILSSKIRAKLIALEKVNIKVGDVRLKSEDEDLSKAPKLMKGLLKKISEESKGNRVNFEEKGMIIDVERLKSIIDVMLDIAEGVEKVSKS